MTPLTPTPTMPLTPWSIIAGTDPVEIDGAGDERSKGLIRATGRPRVAVRNARASGPGFAAFSRVAEVIVERVRTTGVAWILDYADVVRFRDVVVADVGSKAKPAAALNGRFRQFREVDVDTLTIRNVGGDGLHLPGGWTAAGDVRTATPVTGRLRHVTIADVTDTSAHSDAFQLAGASRDLRLENWVVRRAPSALQVTPAQNDANDPGTGSGQSVGLGAHVRLVLSGMLLEDAGPARIFNAPELTIEDVIQAGHGTVALRATQGVVATAAARWAVPHPESDWTTVRVFRRCRIGRLILDPAVRFLTDDGDAGYDRRSFYGCAVGRIDTPDGARHPREATIRTLLEAPDPGEEPPPPDPPAPVPPVDWEARARAAEDRLARVAAVSAELAGIVA